METLGVILVIIGLLAFLAAMAGFIFPKLAKQETRKGVFQEVLLPACLLFGIGVYLSPDPEKVDEPQGVPASQVATESKKELKEDIPAKVEEAPKVEVAEVPKVVEEEKIPISSLSFKSVRKSMKGMTDLQFEEHLKSINNTFAKFL